MASVHHDVMMRTTLNIEDDALQFAKDRARSTGKTVGEIVTDALRKASQPNDFEIIKGSSGFPCFKTSGRGKTLTSEEVIRAWQEEGLDQDATLGR